MDAAYWAYRTNGHIKNLEGLSRVKSYQGWKAYLKNMSIILPIVRVGLQ